MKYNVIKFSDGGYAVSAGRGKFFSTSRTDDPCAAEQDAAYRSAAWYLEQAQKLVNKVSLEDAYKLGHVANDLLDAVADRNLAENPNARADDDRAWLA